MTTRVGPGKRRALQVRKASPRYLTDKTCRTFLEHLAATCNVTAAARAADVTPPPLYRRRRMDEAFAAAWRDAIQAGYERLEEALLARALAEVEFDRDAVAVELVDDAAPGEADDETATGSIVHVEGRTAAERMAKARAGRRRAGGEEAAPPLQGKVARSNVQLALDMLNRREAAERVGRRHRSRPRASIEQIDQELGAKLDGLARRLEEQAE